MIKKILTLFVSVFIAQIAGVIGSFFTVSGVQNWYAFLEKPAGYLFIPYILWVTFAAALNFAVWQLNI